MNKRVTIHDIARIAGVSSATVSRVLSKSSYPVSSKLRTKIEKLAAEHDYIPNMVGKQLKTHQNMTIGVIVPTTVKAAIWRPNIWWNKAIAVSLLSPPHWTVRADRAFIMATETLAGSGHCRIGFDNIDFSQMMAPPLTSIHQPSYEMGKLACSMLMELMRGGQVEIDIVLQPKSIERSTVAAPQ